MRTSTTVLVATLSVLAGCAGVGGPPGTVSPTATPTQTPTVAFPPGYAESGVNVTVAEPRHERLAVESGSLELVARIEIVGEPGRNASFQENITATETYRVDFRNASLRTSVSGPFSHEGYLPPGEEWVYVRTPRENSSVSPYSQRPVGTLTRYANPRLDHVDLFAFVRALDLTRVGSHDGRIRYTATGFEPDAPESRLAGIRPSEFRNVSATLVVDEAGRVRRFAFEGDVHRPRDQYQYTYRLTVTVSGYGSTTPRAPPWLDEARETLDD